MVPLVHGIDAHYAVGGIEQRILDALATAGISLDRLTVDDLAPADEFHIGGRVATDALLEAGALPPGGHVLDLGSGLGGTARYLAARHGHRVTGVDLVQEHVAAARWLTELLHLEDRARFVRASVLDLPFPDGSFDAAIQLHVAMNVADKSALFREVRRVLLPGTPYAIYDVMGAPDAPVELPVPWASEPEQSHLAEPQTYVTLLEQAGFRILHVRDRRSFAARFLGRLLGRPDPPPPLGLHLVMGPDADAKLGHMAAAVERAVVTPVEIVATATP